MAYTNIDDPSAYFQATLYTGTSSSQSITNDGNSDMQPDLWWQKNRDLTRGTYVADSSRGVTKYIYTNLTNAEGTVSTYVTSFDSDGFTLGNGDTAVNNNGQRFVTWNWKANGGTTVSNTDGDLRSVTVQANQDAGFSIVRFLGGTTPYTAGHGLGVAPDVIISKRLGATVGWYVYHKDVGAGKYLQINNENAAVTSATVAFTSAPTSTIFTGGTGIGGATDWYINYCFAEKQGYSKFGTYKGNSNANGPFVYTGFKPACVMVKKTNGTGGWVIMDNKRNTFNVVDKKLAADKNNAESTVSIFDFLSNGFKLRVSNSPQNQTGDTYLYMAFAESPFTTSTGIPTTAR